MKNIILALFLLSTSQLHAAKYMTKTGSVSFVSRAPTETISGVNKSVACLLDSQTGALSLVVLIKSFVFEKQLMQEHFNENYLESDKFPKATFKGQILNINQLDLTKDGDYEVQTAGKLTLHGVTKDVKQTGRIGVKNGKVSISANFAIVLSEYDITIESAFKNKISKEVKVNIACSLDGIK